MAKKKKVDLAEACLRVNEYLTTGFIADCSENESNELAIQYFKQITDELEKVKPRIRKKQIIKGYENDQELLNTSYNISHFLTQYDNIYSSLNNGRKPDYKLGKANIVHANRLLQKMHVFLRKFPQYQITPEFVVSKTLDMLKWLYFSEWIKKNGFSLSYINGVFENAIMEAKRIKEIKEQDAEFLLNNQL